MRGLHAAYMLVSSRGATALCAKDEPAGAPACVLIALLPLLCVAALFRLITCRVVARSSDGVRGAVTPA